MSKCLITFFSASGVTKKAANKIATLVEGDLFEIKPAIPYTDADLNWRDKNSRSSIEMRDFHILPAVAKKIDDLEDYDTVFVGFPVWWYIAPTIINTFIEENDLTGKAVIPFATSGGSGIEKCEDNLKRQYPHLDWKKGQLLNNLTAEKLQDWLKMVMG